MGKDIDRSIVTQAQDMAVFCGQRAKQSSRSEDSATGVLSVVAAALLRPSCDGPADWRKSKD
jgi:hypothetical protein